MTLAKVGSNTGPDLDVIHKLNGQKVYAAGGVRNVADLMALRDTGAAGVLLASALHNGSINHSQLGLCQA